MSRGRPIIYGGIRYKDITTCAEKIGSHRGVLCRCLKTNGKYKGIPIRYESEIPAGGRMVITISETHSEWVSRNTPEGCQPDAFIGAIINDAIAEESEMPKKVNTEKFKSFDVMLPQGARSRFGKALTAIDKAEDLIPEDALTGNSEDLRAVMKHLHSAAENLSELMAYRKMLGVD